MEKHNTKIKEINLPIFDYTIYFVELTENSKYDDIKNILDKICMPKKHIKYIKNRISRNAYDGGECYRNLDLKTFVILVYKSTSSKKRRNIINHELHHCVNRICEHCNLEGKEIPAYIFGYLSEEIN